MPLVPEPSTPRASVARLLNRRCFRGEKSDSAVTRCGDASSRCYGLRAHEHVEPLCEFEFLLLTATKEADIQDLPRVA